MNDDLVKKDYFEKIQKIQKLNKAYYQKNNPTISDQEYDLLKKQVIDLERKYPFLKSNFHHQFQ